MINSTAIDLLKTLSKEEFSELGLFISSPFFNTHKPVILCFEFIKKYFDDFDNPDFTKENLFKKIYPGKTYNDTNVRVNLSAILKLAESYLLHKSNDANEFDNYLLLAKDAFKRSLYKFEEKHIKSCEEILDKKAFLDETYFYDKFSLENTKTQQRKTEDQYQYISSIQVANENLTRFYFSKLLRNYVLILNEKFTVEIDYDVSSVNSVIEMAEKYDFSDYPSIMLYMNLMQMFLTHDMQYYYKAKELFFEQGSEMDDNEKFNIYVYLTNFLFKKHIEKLEPEYINECLTVQLHQLDAKIFGGKYLSYTLYTNIINTAVRTHDYEVTEEIIHKYKDFLSPKNRQSFYEYALASNYYRQGKFTEAMEIFIKTKPVDVFYDLGIKGTLLRIYYELSYYENAFSLVSTYKHTVKSPLLKPADRTFFSKFVTYYLKLLKIKSGTDKSEAQELKHFIEKEPPFTSKSWLLQKVKELR